MGTKFVYGMRLRGFSPGCQPKDGFVERRDSTKYHDEIVYNRRLTDRELADYELNFIGKERPEYENNSKDAVMDRFMNLKAMNTLMISGNDEGIYDTWIYTIPDQVDDDELLDIAENDPDTYAEACGVFLRLMKSDMMEDGGLYIGGEVYGEDD